LEPKNGSKFFWIAVYVEQYILCLVSPKLLTGACKAGKACECKGDTCELHDHSAEDIPELKGVIGEKLLKTLPPSVKTVRLHPKAVLTPLGKEALRKRGITIERGTKP
jgi:predicted metal-binding transcription factor (methanogenesis marker protein 9)